MICTSSHKLLAITQEPEDPATRYRIALHIPSLQAKGVSTTAIPWPRSEDGRRRLIESVSDFDSVVVQRRLLSPRHRVMLRKRARWLAYDFDDAVIYRDSYHGYPWPLPERFIRFRTMISECDAVTAGNDHLASLARRFGKEQRISMVPTVIDLNPYSHGQEHASTSSKTSLGWIGQHTTLPYLEALESPLRQLARRIPGLTLVTISNIHPVMNCIATEKIPWEKESEAKMLATIDIGLAPLPDNRWTRGKCGLRLLQFLAAGIPAVASPVGTQWEVADLGACIPARSDNEWVTSIERLCNDDLLRQELVQTGTELIRKRFVARVWTDDLLSAWCGRKPQ